ncbi:similar to Saccharomyces cerevisiae YBR142W MAK5 Essential nucleolar protein, putative DEAD-box RNA helicase required for maintenance of M1 dsRNA virus [Maudiozyma saulgeensis]|uniref:RNA helicase n=1 Tax=Maudiozyma saulgeensis TaxID=1789683 RepID=A0A1X7R1M5_9SACH|nr:similar to Saccharomyces cerevisiae YBR142W MAK5 Essential nucleolar protein, putative DEAD-box RNA helicase required for maintenance of M1 dsRNA virus [Kazachstania saulgeensis]
MSKNSKQKVQVKLNELEWKTVPITDTLDDFGGFYGLEEIDGVDVKIVNGQAQFFTVDNQIKKETLDDKAETLTADLDTEEKIEDAEAVPYDEGDLIEFKNLDDISEGELSVADGSDDEFGSEFDEEEKAILGSKVENNDDNKETQDELKTNVFNASLDLDDVVSSSELPEWEKVGNLSMTVLQGLSKLGFVKPTEIQAKTVPLGLEGHDIMGKASTGSGKTLAYGIPILEKLVQSQATKNNDPIGLIFTPTRELAQQVSQHLQKITELILNDHNKYSILSLTGGLSIQKQERLLKYDGSGKIVIATPGRFLELLEKNTSLLERFCKIDTLVLDEADRLLQDGHFEEFEKIIKLLRSYRKKSNKSQFWQTMIFSATFSIDLFNKLGSANHHKKKNEKEDELQLVLKHLMTKIHFKSKPIIIDTNPESRISSQIKEALIECAPLERDLFVYYFITMYPGTTLVFCNAIESVKKLNAFLNQLKINTFQIHSSMTQKNRLKNLEKFKEKANFNSKINKATVLIASDVAARGLDIPQIEHVIHYHLPRTADVYIHRSGRTARASNEGVAVVLCSPQESVGPLRRLRKMLASDDVRVKSKGKKMKWQKTIPLLPIESDILAQLKDRSTLASELADNEIASNSLHKDDNWLAKAAEDLGIDVDSDDENKDVYLAKNKTKKLNKTISKDQAKFDRMKLNELLSIQLRKDRRQKYLTGGLVNLADHLVKKRGHNDIIGHEKIDALELLKNKKKRK